MIIFDVFDTLVPLLTLDQVQTKHHRPFQDLKGFYKI